MIWFTSDTHFGHENVLKFTDRPWETIWQMNDAIVDSINGRVAVDDELYILGDFSFKMTAQDAYGLRKRIACRRIHSSGGAYNEFNRKQGLLRYDVGCDANGHSPVSLDELREWFAGVDEPCGRVKWPWWVNETGDRQVERELAAYKRKEQSQ